MGLTILPFFFIRSFERYLYGSLVPSALLLASLPLPSGLFTRWAARVGMLLLMLLGLPLIALALWLNEFPALLLIGLPAPAWMMWQWWRARNIGLMTLSAALCWVYLLGMVYPRLGINQIPEPILQQATERKVALYQGPQPAMLPAVLNRGLTHLHRNSVLPERLADDCDGFLLFVRDKELQQGREWLDRNGLQILDSKNYGILSSRVRWQNMLRRDAGAEQFRQAMADRDLEPIKPRVHLFDVRSSTCTPD